MARGSLPGSQRFEESMAALAAQLAVKPITDKQSGGTSPVLTAVSEEASPPRKKLKRASPTPIATLLILDDDEDQIKLLCKMMGAHGLSGNLLHLSGSCAGPSAGRPWRPDTGIPFIHKPFTAPDLILRIREVLKSGAGHSTTMDANN